MITLIVDAAVRARLPRPGRDRLRRRLARMVRAASATERLPRELEVSFRLTDDRFIHALNRDFRGKDRPTDVLAFALREGEGGDLHPEILGDVVISVETAARQAKENDVAGEIEFLSAHGFCHLLGYDHQTDAEEAEMNARAGGLLAEARRRGPLRPA